MSDLRYLKASRIHAELRHKLTPESDAAFRSFSDAVFKDGALDSRSKQLIAVAVVLVTQCPWCIEEHVKTARRAGASPEQIKEAIWVAAEMRAGATYAHATKTLDMMLNEPT